LGNLELGLTTLAIVAVLVGIRAVLWELGVEGLSPTALSAGIITGGVFVVGLVVAGTLSDYRDAERAPTDLATGLLLRIYHLQREEFLPSAYAMIVAFVSLIVVLLMFTNFDGEAESLVTVGFLSFFFLALLRLLNIISTPFKVGVERTEDDVSLFLLNEFVVQVQASEAGETVVEDIEAEAEEVEEQLVEVEEKVDDPTKVAERGAARLAPDEGPA
jgi:hypothetical protein